MTTVGNLNVIRCSSSRGALVEEYFKNKKMFDDTDWTEIIKNEEEMFEEHEMAYAKPFIPTFMAMLMEDLEAIREFINREHMQDEMWFKLIQMRYE